MPCFVGTRYSDRYSVGNWTSTLTLSDTLLLSVNSTISRSSPLPRAQEEFCTWLRNLPRKRPVAEDPRYTQALQSYEAGLRAMQEHKFDKAKPHFQKVIAGPIKELIDRASIHLSICNQHLERSAATQFKTAEEHFDYAVSLMNVGDYVTAREHLDKLLKQNAQVGLCGLRSGRARLPHRPRRRFPAPAGRGPAPECATAFPGAQRFRLPEPGGGSALHRTALSRSRRRTRRADGDLGEEEPV